MQGDRLNMSSRFFFRNAPGDGFLFGSGLLLWWMFFLLLMLYPLPAALDGDVLATAVAAAGKECHDHHSIQRACHVAAVSVIEKQKHEH